MKHPRTVFQLIFKCRGHSKTGINDPGGENWAVAREGFGPSYCLRVFPGNTVRIATTLLCGKGVAAFRPAIAGWLNQKGLFLVGLRQGHHGGDSLLITELLKSSVVRAHWANIGSPPPEISVARYNQAKGCFSKRGGGAHPRGPSLLR